MKKIISRFIPCLILALTVLLVWHKTLNQVFMGEGYVYFDTRFPFISNGNFSDLWRYDNFARIAFDILAPIFKDNILYYLAFQLLTLVFLATVLFYLTKYFTKNNWISFSASIIFATSYLGLFEMIGTGNYQRFVQRIPNIIPQLLALLQLARYIDTKKISYYFWSLFLFAISVFMAHYSTFLLPAFIIYPLAFSISHKSSFKKLWQNIFLSIPFIILNLILISKDPFTPNGHFLTFIKNFGIGKVISSVTLQFSNMIIPPFLVEKISAITSSYDGILIIITIPILILFILGAFLLRKKQNKLSTIYLTSLFLIPTLLFLNIYLEKVDPIHNMRGYTYYFLPNIYSANPALTATVKGDRYYMLPYIFLAILIAILIYVFAKSISANFYKGFTFLFISAYVLYNSFLVQTNIARIQPVSEDLKLVVSHIRSISYQLNNESLIVIPREFFWLLPMVQRIYQYPNLKFITKDTSWKEQIKNINQKNVILIDFYYDKTKDGELNPANNRVISGSI